MCALGLLAVKVHRVFNLQVM